MIDLDELRTRSIAWEYKPEEVRELLLLVDKLSVQMMDLLLSADGHQTKRAIDLLKTIGFGDEAKRGAARTRLKGAK